MDRVVKLILNTNINNAKLYNEKIHPDELTLTDIEHLSTTISFLINAIEILRDETERTK